MSFYLWRSDLQYPQTHTHTHKPNHTHKHTQKHTPTNTHTLTQLHTHTHTHTHNPSPIHFSHTTPNLTSRLQVIINLHFAQGQKLVSGWCVVNRNVSSFQVSITVKRSCFALANPFLLIVTDWEEGWIKGRCVRRVKTAPNSNVKFLQSVYCKQSKHNNHARHTIVEKINEVFFNFLYWLQQSPLLVITTLRIGCVCPRSTSHQPAGEPPYVIEQDPSWRLVEKFPSGMKESTSGITRWNSTTMRLVMIRRSHAHCISSQRSAEESQIMTSLIVVEFHLVRPHLSPVRCL